MHDGKPPVEALSELAHDYEILGRIGQGAMAVVYRARERAGDREVAIKLIRARYIQDEETLARCAREAETVMRLQHLNIVATFGARTLADGSLALIMAYVSARTLRDVLREEGALSCERAAQILIDLGRALVYAHECGIIHRDIKPENICIDERTGAALLSDFGLAKPIDSDTQITHTGATMGTPVYMSPEQIDALPVDERTDLYSLGMVGWEMLAGTRPWAGEGLYGVIYRQKHEELPALATLRSDAPPALVAAIEGALRKDREDRWESALDFLAQLDPTADPYPTRAALRRRGRVLATALVARQSPASAAADQESTLRFRRAQATPEARPPHGRFRSVSRVAAVAMLLLGGGAAVMAALSQRGWQPEVAAATHSPVEAFGPESVSGEAGESVLTRASFLAEPGAGTDGATPASRSFGDATAPPLETASAPPAAAEQQRPAPASGRTTPPPPSLLASVPGVGAAVPFTTPQEIPRPMAAARQLTGPPDCQSARFDPHGQHRLVDERCSIRLVVGESHPLRVELGPLATERRGPRSVAWRSSNPAVAAVDREGVVKGLKPGGATISATAGDMGGTTTVLVVAGPPARPVILSGDGQAGIAGLGLPAALVVRVTDAYGNPLRGVAVSWAATGGGGLVRAAAAHTDEAGVVRATWVLGRAVGTQTASAAVAGLAPVTFTAVATAEGGGGSR